MNIETIRTQRIDIHDAALTQVPKSEKPWSHPIHVDFEVTQDDWKVIDIALRRKSTLSSLMDANARILRNQFRLPEYLDSRMPSSYSPKIYGLLGQRRMRENKSYTLKVSDMLTPSSWDSRSRVQLEKLAIIRLLDMFITEEEISHLFWWDTLFQEYENFYKKNDWRMVATMLLNIKIAQPEKLSTFSVDSAFYEGTKMQLDTLRKYGDWHLFLHTASDLHLLRAYRIYADEDGLVVDFKEPHTFESGKPAPLPVLRAF